MALAHNASTTVSVRLHSSNRGQSSGGGTEQGYREATGDRAATGNGAAMGDRTGGLGQRGADDRGEGELGSTKRIWVL